MQNNFSIINLTKGKLPGLPFVKMKDDILGKKYSLSVAYVEKKKSGAINLKYRRKDRATNILAFPLRQNSGEIILCPAVIKRESADSGKSIRQFLGFLVIHGMLHLKGMKHSSTMSKSEKKYFDRYDKKYFSGNRRRVLEDEGRNRRVHKGRKKS